ncbi:peptidoglycan-binding protein [Streptomyces fragilis]|uniref:Peptidoglycan-binding protein n=1 Tax=Streptomyces fragilis TaxID=67301 RepID=A0ABV2YCQ3_9ACTN|nr:peptidoglycan-binding protein [Streptomyces fragilis]
MSDGSTSAGEHHEGGSGLTRRRRWAAGIATGAVLVSGVGLAAGQMIKSPAQAAADSLPPPPSVLTAPVERRVLEDSVTVRGTVTAAQTVDVAPTSGAPEGGAPVVTKLPVGAGQRLRAGQLLVEVSGRPVFALRGDLPMFRDLKPGAEGDDVAQLQRALGDVGYSTAGDREGRFGERTKAALTAFYSGIGYAPLPAQPDGEQSVESAEAAVTRARRAVEDAESGLSAARRPSTDGTAAGDDDGTPDGDDGTATGAPDTSALGRQAQRAREDLATAREELTRVRAAAGPTLPASEVVFLSRFPARVDEVHSRVGGRVEGNVMSLSAGALVVDGLLQQHEKGLVRPGQKVEILSEVTGRSASGKVTGVADTPGRAQEAGAPDADGGNGAKTDGASGYLMVVKPDKALPADLAGQDVRLTVRAASTNGEALVVPLSAISAGADGRTTVTVVQDDVRHRVPVVTGTTGDGYVEVRPLRQGALSEGERVLVGVRAGPRAGAGADL